MKPSVTVITATTGNPLLAASLESVASQTYGRIQHLVVIDGTERSQAARRIIARRPVDLIELPYATGTKRYNGHRIYGAGTYLAKGDLVCFLDEDNWMDANHIESLVEVIRSGNQWAFSLRKIVDKAGEFICLDNCESLGKWPTILSPDDYLVDVNCFMLPKPVALMVSPAWYRKAKQAGVVPVDRMLTRLLRMHTSCFDSNYLYSMNYRVEATSISVTASFFRDGNGKMAEKFPDGFPWSAAR